MTPEEIVESLDANSRKILAEQGLTVSDAMVNLLRKAGMRGFQLGSQTALSMMKGALLVKKMGMDKSKEAGK